MFPAYLFCEIAEIVQKGDRSGYLFLFLFVYGIAMMCFMPVSSTEFVSRKITIFSKMAGKKKNLGGKS